VVDKPNEQADMMSVPARFDFFYGILRMPKHCIRFSGEITKTHCDIKRETKWQGKWSC
jgi:hypothetical protein